MLGFFVINEIFFLNLKFVMGNVLMFEFCKWCIKILGRIEIFKLVEINFIIFCVNLILLEMEIFKLWCLYVFFISVWILYFGGRIIMGFFLKFLNNMFFFLVIGCWLFINK